MTRPSGARGPKAGKRRLRSDVASSSTRPKVKPPSKADLARWPDATLAELAARIDAEQWRRDDARRAAEADERARTVIHTRFEEQGIRCGTPGCRCASGELHGPYWYAIDTYGDGRRKKRYVGKNRPKGA